MKVYKGFLTGIAALALLFSMVFLGCETPTGDPGPRGADVPNYLKIESDITVVAPGSTQNVFKAIFNGDDVSHSTLTKWEVSGDGMYANYTGLGTPVDGHHPATDFQKTGALLDQALGGGVMLDVDADEEAGALQVTATHGGYSASWQLTTGARGLEYIRLIPGSTDGTTKIELYESSSGTILTQPDFGYYFVWEKSDAPDLNVLKTKQVNVQNTVNEAEDIPVKNGDWITIYEVPQDNLTNETVHGYVSLQVHASTNDIITYVPGTTNVTTDTNPHDVLIPNLYEPAEFLTQFLSPPTANTVLDIADPISADGITSVVTQGTNYAAFFEGKYRAYAIDTVTWNSTKTFKKDAALVTSGAVEISGASVVLPTAGQWRLVVQHIETGAWWEIDTALVKHAGYIKGWPKEKEENILTITIGGGKKLIDWQQIAVNGIPFTLKPEGWDNVYATTTGYSTVTLFLGDLDMDALGGIPAGATESLFVSGSGGGVAVSIPASHFLAGTTPVTKTDPDVQVSWGIDSTIRGRVVTGGVKLDDDENSSVRVIDTFTGADISSHYTFRWYYVDGKTWTDTPYYTGEGTYGQQGSSYYGGGVEFLEKRYLGLKVIPAAGYAVRTDSEFVFGAFTD